MPSQVECAAMSLYVYQDQPQTPLPAGWEQFMFWSGGDLDGYVFVNRSKNPAEVCFVYPGTHDLYDLMNDYEYYFEEKVPALFESAKIFIPAAIQLLNKDLGVNNYSLTFSGHSMGGMLAELSLPFAFQYYHGRFSPQCYTFESPGARPFVESLMQSGDLPPYALDMLDQVTIVYCTDVNAINTCFPHVGIVGNNITPNYVGYSYVPMPLEGYPLDMDTAYFFLCFTVEDQHSMVKIYNQLSNNPNVQGTPIAWPINPHLGYQYYLTYNPPNQPAHQTYWDTYIQDCWDFHTDIHTTYNNNFELFKQDFIHYNLQTISTEKTAVNTRSTSFLQIMGKMVKEIRNPQAGQPLINEMKLLESKLMDASPSEVEQLNRYHVAYTKALKIIENKKIIEEKAVQAEKHQFKSAQLSASRNTVWKENGAVPPIAVNVEENSSCLPCNII